MPTPAARRERSAAVLVVEQDASIAAVLQEILRDEGYTVVAVHDGQAGLRAAALSPPDLVVLEPRLPVLDAPTFLVALRRFPAGRMVPVLAVSSSLHPERLTTELDVQGTVGKPFEIDELLAAVRRLARPPASD